MECILGQDNKIGRDIGREVGRGIGGLNGAKG